MRYCKMKYIPGMNLILNPPIKFKNQINTKIYPISKGKIYEIYVILLKTEKFYFVYIRITSHKLIILKIYERFEIHSTSNCSVKTQPERKYESYF